jgi:5'-methylthioadenosine phosphorylase
VTRVPAERTCACASALATAIITRPDAVPPETRRDLAPLLGKYLERR